MSSDDKKWLKTFGELAEAWKVGQWSSGEPGVKADPPVAEMCATEACCGAIDSAEGMAESSQDDGTAAQEVAPGAAGDGAPAVGLVERDPTADLSPEGELERLRQLVDIADSENQRLLVRNKATAKSVVALRKQVRRLERQYQDHQQEKRLQVRRLKREIKDAGQQISSLQDHLTVATGKITRLTNELTQVTYLQEPLAWLAQELGSDPDIFHPEVVIVGRAPFDAEDLTRHFRSRGITSRKVVAPKVEVMIVGRDGWTELDLEKQIYAREGETLRVYSQELALMSLAVGRDILAEASHQFLLRLATGHPALEFLARSELRWPECYSPRLPDQFEPFDADRGDVDQSPLKQLGYTVGKTQGLAPSRRQEILRVAFSEGLPWTHSDEYMADWGQPRTRRRLWRIAHHLAWLARSWRRMPSHKIAVGDWVDDLVFLRRAYFRPYMRFTWPQTRVPGR